MYEGKAKKQRKDRKKRKKKTLKDKEDSRVLLEEEQIVQKRKPEDITEEEKREKAETEWAEVERTQETETKKKKKKPKQSKAPKISYLEGAGRLFGLNLSSYMVLKAVPFILSLA